MKNILIIAVLSVWSVAAIPHETTNYTKTTTELYSPSVAKVKIKAGLGRGSSCRGRGLCLIVIVRSALEGVQEENQGLAMASYSGNTLTLEFLKSSMTPATLNRHFANGEFIVEEDAKLDAGVVSSKDDRKMLLVPKGKYQVEDSGSYLIITLENCLISS